MVKNIANNLNDTIAAVVTAPGEGAVGIIRISGDNALCLANSIFNLTNNNILTAEKTHLMQYGHIFNEKSEKIDEVFAVYMKAPRSYTAEDVVEIHCHGGLQSLKSILDRKSVV